MLSGKQLQGLLDGAWITIQVFVFAALLATALALIFGVMSVSNRRYVRALARVYVEVTRGVSAIVLLFTVAFAIPIILGVKTFIFTAAIVALGINMSGFGAEVVRTGIRSVPPGQVEAAIAINLRPWDRLRSVILPQAIMVMIPPYGNLSIQYLKGTSLVALVGLSDLTYAAQSLRAQRFVIDNPPSTAAIFGMTLVIYFVMSQILTFFFRWLERSVGGKWYGIR